MQNVRWFLVGSAGLATVWACGCASDGHGRQVEMMNQTAPMEQKAAGPHIRFLDPEHAPVGEGWVSLFNGEDTQGWHKRDANREMSWHVEDHILHNASSEEKQGNDLVSDPKFKDFEVYYEYRVPKGSNSGFYLRGRYEIQIFDSFGKPPSEQDNGAIYGLKAPSRNVSRPSNQWQSVYARLVDKKVTIIQNGEKTIDDFELTRATGLELDQDYDQPGPILLQGNHGSVDFRYIYVKPLAP